MSLLDTDTPSADTLDVAAYALAHGLTPEGYHERWTQRITAPMTGLDRDARLSIGYSRLNAPRSRAITDAYVPSDRLMAALRALPLGQTWVVLTDDWCGDSAFEFPIIEAAAARSEAVTLRVLIRDEHLGVMDRYLTNGGRAIPILAAFDADGREAWTWGPRSAEGVAYRASLVEGGMEKGKIAGAMVEWYEAGGWTHLDAELAARIEGQLGW